MKKVILIPYFGKFPNYFSLFLLSCAKNKDFDFFIFSDQQVELKKSYNNIFIYNFSFEKLQDLVKRKLGNQCNLYSPYKLCDYRGAYGKIFEDYLKEYDIWGYCDCDIIFGKISDFLPETIFEENDKIQIEGHLSFYKNTEIINSLYKSKKTVFLTFDKVIKYKEPCFFDEISMPDIAKNHNLKFYLSNQYADILPQHYMFHLSKRFGKCNYKDQIFYYKNGNLFRKYKNEKYVEEKLMYIHLQKRKMEYHNIDLEKTIYILPNRFSNCLDNLNSKLISRLLYYLNYLKYQVKKIQINRIKIKLTIIKGKFQRKRNNDYFFIN